MVKSLSVVPIRTIVLFVLLGAAATGSAVAAPHDSANGAEGPAILVATVIDTDPSALPTSGLFLVQVDEVIQGSIPGSVLVVESDGTGVAGRPLPGPARLVPGRRLHLVLGEEGNRYRVLDSRVTGDRGAATSWEPPGIVLSPPFGEGAAPRLTPKATATAPYEHQVVELTNERRWANGNLPPYKKSAELGSSAGLHSSNMAVRDFFSHCDPDTGTSSRDRILAAGYAAYYSGENIAAGYATPEAVVQGWMDSSGHRAAILSTFFWEIGVGYTYQSTDQATVRLDLNADCAIDSTGNGPYFNYWTQNFGNRYQGYPVVIEREAWETTTTSVALYVYGEGWAQEMRFSNDGATWSAWETYSPNKLWTLSGGGGEKTVWAQIRNGATVLEASDTISYVTTCTSFPDVVDPGVTTVTGLGSWTACDMVTSGGGFQVGAAGDVTFRAKNRVVLRDGFSVASGGSLKIEVDPTLE